MRLSRRRFMGAAGAFTALTLWPGWVAAEGGSDTRLLVVLLRGALDGLHALPPQDDPQYRRLRGALAPQQAKPLEGSFALHPSLSFAHGLYARSQLLPVLAIAPPYRQRSHFEAQDCLENGTATANGAATGWLNRCVAAMPATEGLSISAVTPLILRGDGDTGTWSPPLPETVSPSLLQSLQPLYAADPRLAAGFARALQNQGMGVGDATAGNRLPQAMAAAASFMSRADGPRIAFVEDTGWDTHSNQAPVLDRKLAELDRGLKTFHDGAVSIWARTAIAVVTEFGRTAAANGTGGTDHGTGGTAFLAGGAVRGGRIAGDWPGLASTALNEGRDLRATTDMRALFKGLLRDHLRIPESAVETQVFPDSGRIRPLDALIA